MSHFSVVVFLPKDTPPDKIESAIEQRIAPYDESKVVESYDRVCWCVGKEAQRAARAEADVIHGTREQRVHRLNDLMKEQTDVVWPERTEDEHTKEDDDRFFAQVEAFLAYKQQKWDEINAPWFAESDRIFAERSDKDAANPECSNCKGKGTYVSTYNPKSKWDWWVIGGRWDGGLMPTETREVVIAAETEMGQALPQSRQPVEGWNVCRSVNLPDGWVPFAIVTDSGEWHEKAKMGMFASTSDEKPEEDWHAEAAEIASGHADHIAVLIDCHI